MRKLLVLNMGFLMLFSGACEYENEESLFGKEAGCVDEVVFQTHIQPLIQTNCAVSGCHVAGGQSPELTSFEKVKSRATDVVEETQSLHMPPPSSGKSLSKEEIDLIACWVQQGTKNE